MPRKSKNARRVYDQIRSGELTFEQFQERFLDEWLATAIQQIDGLVKLAGLRNVRCLLTSRSWHGQFVFEILQLNPNGTSKMIASITLMDGRYSFVNEPWMSRRLAAIRLRQFIGS